MERKNIKRVLLRLLCLAVAVAWGGAAMAQSISRETAHRIAETFFTQNTRNGQGQPVQFEDITAETPFQNFYIFSADSGFVLVAADERVTPILGYSKKSPFVTENMPENLRWWLEGYDRQIQEVRQRGALATDEISAKWYTLLNGESVQGNRSVVGPLLTTNWGQDDPYNLLCPYDEDVGVYCHTGCAATAMAQIMKRWEHPLQGKGSHIVRKLLKKHPSYYPLEVDFGATTYDWDNMPDNGLDYDTEEERMAVATLMYHCGVSINIDYDYLLNGTTGDGRLVPIALAEYFGYKSTARLIRRSDYNDEEWVQILKNELNADPPRPVYYGGHSITDGNHAFVCDGYDEEYDDGYFHFNWGWDGFYNTLFSGEYSYFSINNVGPNGYNSSQSAIIGIEPEIGTVSATILPNDGGVVTGTGTYRITNPCTLIATPNVGYAFAGWYNGTFLVSMSPSYTFTVNGDRTLTAMFAPANYTITTTALPTVGGSVSGGGTYPAGSVVTVSASAHSGYRFNGWVENGQLVATSNSYMFAANADRNLTATFVSTQLGIGSVVTNADGTKGVLFHFEPSGVGWMVAMDDSSEGCPWGPETNIQILPDQPCEPTVILKDLSGFMNTGLIRT